MSVTSSPAISGKRLSTFMSSLPSLLPHILYLISVFDNERCAEYILHICGKHNSIEIVFQKFCFSTV